MSKLNLINKLENNHSLTATLLIANACAENPRLVEELFKIIDGSNKILSQRAAWPIGHIAITNPHILLPYTAKLISLLKKENLHQAVYRNAMKALSVMDTDEEFAVELIDLSFNIIVNEGQAIATRSYAMDLALKQCLPYIELTNELGLLTSTLIDHKSAAIRSKSKQLSKAIKKARP